MADIGFRFHLREPFSLMLRDVFLGFIRIHVLHHAAQEPIYGAAMIEELERHGYAMSPGTLYPLLHGMEEKGYLTREEHVVEGRVRKYYTATEEGRRALGEIRVKLGELVEEVLEGNGPMLGSSEAGDE